MILRGRIRLVILLCAAWLAHGNGSPGPIKCNGILRGSVHSSARAFTALTLRGGKGGKGGAEEAAEEDDKGSSSGDGDGDLDVDVDVDGDVDDSSAMDGQQNQMLTSIGELWSKTPPMTQVYVGGSILLTVASFLLNKNNWPELLNLEWGAVLTKFQLWRPMTAFLFFGPLGLNYLLTIHFVWTYMAQLEKLNYKKPEEFFVMMAFGAVALLVGYTVSGLSPKFLGHNLSTFLVYIWARIFEGTDVNVMVSRPPQWHMKYRRLQHTQLT